MSSGEVYLDSSNGHIHGAYIDGGTVHASRIDADNSIYLGGSQLKWSKITYISSINTVGVVGGTQKVVTDVQQSGDGRGITVSKRTISWVANVILSYNTATAYILGNNGGTKSDLEGNGFSKSVGDTSSYTVSLSGFASSNHHHSGSMSGTAQVDITTGYGSANVSGRTGGPE